MNISTTLFDQTNSEVESSAAEAPIVKDVDYHTTRISIKNCLIYCVRQ